MAISDVNLQVIEISTCPGFYREVNTAMMTLSEANSNVVSNQFMQYVVDTVNEINDESKLRFSTLVALDAEHFFTMASATTSSTLDPTQIAPASVMIYELYTDNTVKAYFNNDELVPEGCLQGVACPTSTWLASLTSKIS